MATQSERSQFDQFITTRKAAEILGVSLRTVQLWVEDGVLSAWKTPGGHRRIIKSSVYKVLNNRREALHQSESSDALRVLIIEDEPMLLELYKLEMGAWGIPISIETATDGFEGLMKVGQCHPDVVITDLIMPNMDGFAMIHALSNQTNIANMNIVAVTVLNQEEIDARGGLPNDVTVYQKPIPFEKLQAFLTARMQQTKPDFIN